MKYTIYINVKIYVNIYYLSRIKNIWKICKTRKGIKRVVKIKYIYVHPHISTQNETNIRIYKFLYIIKPEKNVQDF